MSYHTDNDIIIKE